jgi:outer membrane biosynthesis protein TonB
MKSKILIVVFIAILFFSTQILPLISYCQPPKPPPTPTPDPNATPTPAPTPTPTPTPTLEPETPEPWTTPRVTPKPKDEDAPSFPFIEALLGVVVVAGGGISAFVFVKKRKVNEKSLKRLSSSEFQDWVLKKLNGKSSSSKDSAMGIDGFTTGGQPVSIKQSDGVGMSAIESFTSALARNRAREGVIVAFSFGSDAMRGKVRAKMNYGLEIQMLTVDELIDNRKPF